MSEKGILRHIDTRKETVCASDLRAVSSGGGKKPPANPTVQQRLIGPSNRIRVRGSREQVLQTGFRAPGEIE
ncbi:MAG: hypothetical protein ABSH25_20240, partial [Syntrophorhabdales bacterium]